MGQSKQSTNKANTDESTSEILDASKQNEQGGQEASSPDISTIERIQNKLLDFLINLNKRIETFLKSPLGKFSIVTIIFLIFAGPILLTVLGFDNVVIRSSLEGNIIDLDNKSIQGAEIKLQGQTISSDATGYYKFDNLDYGMWQITIKAPGYENFSDQITINRFSNNMDFKLTPLDFGEFTGSFSNEDLNLDQLFLSINDQEVQVNDDGTFNTGRLVIGTYDLILESPYYKDIEREIEVKSGTNTADPIELQPAGDIIGVTYHFLGERILEEVDIKVRGTEKSVTFEEDNFIIKDITEGNVVQLNFTKDGYKEKILDITIEAGENSLDKVLLVPEGRIISRNNGRIVISDIDGEDQNLLSEDSPNCIILTITSSSIGSKCGNSLYRGYLDSGTVDYLGFIYADAGMTNSYEVVAIDNTGTSTVTIDSEIVFQTDNDIVSWTGDNTGANIYISTTSGVYWENLDDENEPVKFTDGIFDLQDLNANENMLVALNQANSEGTLFNIWTISTTGEKNRETILPKAFSDVQWITNEKIVYLASENGEKSLYKYNINNDSETLLISGIDNYIYDANVNLYTVSAGSERYVLNLNGHIYRIGD